MYQIHIRYGGFLGQQRLATHLISVVVWLSWQPKRYFVFSSYFKSSQMVWRLLRTIDIGHIHHCYGNSVAMATILIPQYYFGISLICIVLGNKYPLKTKFGSLLFGYSSCSAFSKFDWLVVGQDSAILPHGSAYQQN